VLVNNAAVYKLDPLEKVTEEEFHREFNTNVLGPLLMIREAVKYFGPSGGSIVNIGSAASQLNPPNQLIYNATKSAVDVITPGARKGVGVEKDSSELDQSRCNGNRRRSRGRRGDKKSPSC
jgi:3-oxoacyl-[acyl-carrier protein] reductase